jgi:hypothetical protein
MELWEGGQIPWYHAFLRAQQIRLRLMTHWASSGLVQKLRGLYRRRERPHCRLPLSKGQTMEIGAGSVNQRTVDLLNACRDLIAEAEYWLAQAVQTDGSRLNADHLQTFDLPRRLDSTAYDMSCSKALEFHSDIPTLIMLAAKVALLAFGNGSQEVGRREKAVYYYRAFPSTEPLVEDYEAFKQRAQKP